MNIKALMIFSLIVLLLTGCGSNSNKVNTSKNEKSIKQSLEQQTDSEPDKSIIPESRIVSTTKPSVLETKPSEDEKNKYDHAYDLWYNSKSNEAIKEFEAFISMFPNSSLADDAQKMIGTAYTNLKQYDKAILEYKTVIDKYPESSSASITLYNIAHTYFYSLNDFSNAHLYYSKFIEEATVDDEKWLKIAIDQLNNWQNETKRYEGYAQGEDQNDKLSSSSKTSYEKEPSDDDKAFA